MGNCVKTTAHKPVQLKGSRNWDLGYLYQRAEDSPNFFLPSNRATINPSSDFTEPPNFVLLNPKSPGLRSPSGCLHRGVQNYKGIFV